ANARREGVLRIMRLAEGNQAGHIGNLVQRLQPLGERNGGVFVPQAKIYGEVAADLPVVIGEPIKADLVAIIVAVAGAARAQLVRGEIAHIKMERAVVVITT